jgi:hypothetical protein
MKRNSRVQAVLAGPSAPERKGDGPASTPPKRHSRSKLPVSAHQFDLSFGPHVELVEPAFRVQEREGDRQDAGND